MQAGGEDGRVGTVDKSLFLLPHRRNDRFLSFLGRVGNGLVIVERLDNDSGRLAKKSLLELVFRVFDNLLTNALHHHISSQIDHRRVLLERKEPPQRDRRILNLVELLGRPRDHIPAVALGVLTIQAVAHELDLL